MSLRFSRRRCVHLGAAAAVLGIVMFSVCSAEKAGQPEDKEPARPAAEPADTSKPPEKAKPPKKPDPFLVPDGTPEELLKYLEDLGEQRPKSRSRDDVRQFRVDMGRAILTTADKILAAKATDDQASEAVRAKIVALSILQSVGQKDAAKLLAGFPEELKKAGRSKRLVREARTGILRVRLSHRPPTSAEAMEGTLGEVKQLLAEGSIGPEEIELAMSVAMHAEQMDAAELAVKAYQSLGTVVATSKDPQIASLGAKMLGAARRLSILGKPMEIHGKTHDGKPFDWAAYQGKVVLVDFWATWCGPCLAEFASILENYEAYHDRGFDVVGISIDEDLGELKAFLKRKKLPWTVLVNTPPKNGEPDRSMATHYGIFGIPSLFLVGRDGKVISTQVRGEQLGEHLEKLLGPPKKKEKPREETKREDGKTE